MSRFGFGFGQETQVSNVPCVTPLMTSEFQKVPDRGEKLSQHWHCPQLVPQATAPMPCLTLKGGMYWRPASHEPSADRKHSEARPLVKGDERTGNPGCDVRNVQIPLCVTGIKEKSTRLVQETSAVQSRELKLEPVLEQRWGTSPCGPQLTGNVVYARARVSM